MQRRDFLRYSALGAAAATLAPASGMVMTAAPKKNASRNDKVRMGFIGLGQQAMYLLNGFMSMDDVRVVAGCDVYDIKRDRFVRRVKDYYTGKGEKKVKVDVYEDYQDLLARPDIDAVVIATPDHQHAVIAIAACKAGKDVYLEKPATLTVYEGQQLVKAVRKYNRILQMGSQQRSSEEFIHAANLAREGELGRILKMKVFVGRNDVNPVTGAPAPCNLPRMAVPAGLNWDKWLGPLPETVYGPAARDGVLPLGLRSDHHARARRAALGCLALVQSVRRRPDDRLGRAYVRHCAMGPGQGRQRSRGDHTAGIQLL